MVNGGSFTIMTANLKIENTFGETEKDGLKDITTQGGCSLLASTKMATRIFVKCLFAIFATNALFANLQI